IPDETFIQVMVDLRRAAAASARDTSGVEAMRDSILADAGVTDFALYAWGNATADDPERMGRVLRQTRDSMQARPEPGTNRGGEPPTGSEIAPFERTGIEPVRVRPG